MPLGINRANVRSPAITWKIWSRLLVGRAAAMQAVSVPVDGSSEKYVFEVPPTGYVAICSMVWHGAIVGLVSVVHPVASAPKLTEYTIVPAAQAA